MKKILILTGRYLPGYKDGGPVRTIKNLTDSLGDKYSFTIMCADRDHGDTDSYENVQINAVNRVGKADVFYVENGAFSLTLLKAMANENDIIYVCGPYNDYAIKALILKRLGLIKSPLIMAPMGSFSKGALALKSTKKKIFLKVFKLLSLFKDVVFSVTSEMEEKELKEALKINNKCYVAEDPQRYVDNSLQHLIFKNNEKLNVVFLSRICEKKNLEGAVRILSKVKKKVCFHVYGIIEDAEYYEKCKALMINLPVNIQWEYMGEAESENVPEIFSKYDVFLFPTLGENFGHVISEALSAGTIPVLSDTTPWNDLEEKESGYVTNLSDTERFVAILENLCDMSNDELKTLSQNARKYYENKYENEIKNSGYITMFDEN